MAEICKNTQKPRESGYYWVRMCVGGEWTIAYYSCPLDRWGICFAKQPIEEKFFKQIGRKIEPELD